MSYMANRCGSWQAGDDPRQGEVEFKIFFPKGFDPKIKRLRVAGDFQSAVSAYADWDFEHGIDLTPAATPDGVFWSCRTPRALKAGYYQYKYLVEFANGRADKMTDPCCRYGGRENQNAAFVVGGSRPADNVVKPLKSGARPFTDLVVYELMIDDFTAGYRGGRAPLGAVIDKLDHIKGLGFNAILFMPWTSWKNTDFSWGYEPFQYFAVEHRYTDEAGRPEEKISWLKKLINACHEKDIHVMLDGVFNHVSNDFPYQKLYQDPVECPFTGDYGGGFPGLQDLDFNNDCSNDFILDVCMYWIDVFGIDGLRLDNTINYYEPGDHRGLTELIPAIRDKLAPARRNLFSFTLEHIAPNAPAVVGAVKATSYWDNALFERTFQYLFDNRIDAHFLNALTDRRFLASTDQAPTLYLSNHDHSQVAWQAGANENAGRGRWFRTQPYVIALYTSPAVPLVYNGAEFAEDDYVPEDDRGTGARISPRPLRWSYAADAIGAGLTALYRRMGQIRNDFPGLRSPNFDPAPWEEWQTQFNPAGLGVDLARQVAIYRRWGNDDEGQIQQFVIALNFSNAPQSVSVPFPTDGTWTDLLSNYIGDWKIEVKNKRLDLVIDSHWGHVFYKG